MVAFARPARRIITPDTRLVRLSAASPRDARMINQFLLIDQPGAVVRTTRSLSKTGQFRIGGATINSHLSTPQIHLAIGERPGPAGVGQQKILWGWEIEEAAEVGNYESCDIQYVLSFKDGKMPAWSRLPSAKLTFTSNLNELLGRGFSLGGRVLEREWEVKLTSVGQGMVRYCSREIYGFNARLGNVFSFVREQEDQDGLCIAAHFFTSRQQALAGRGRIKEAILSRAKIDGSGEPAFELLPEAKLVFTLNRTQRWKAEGVRIRKFLVEERPEGAAIPIGPRKISDSGNIVFSVEGKHISVFVSKDFPGSKAYGKIVREGNTKKAHFWLDKKRKGILLNPQGRVVGRLEDGQWKIIWVVAVAETKERSATEEYAKYLFSTANGKPHREHWRVYRKKTKRTDHFTAHVKRYLRKNTFDMAVPAHFNGDRVFSMTQEYAGRFKIVSFWEKEQHSLEGESPFAKSLIMFKPNHGSWQFFQHKLDDWPALEQLLLEQRHLRQISPRELYEVLKEISEDHPEVLPHLTKLETYY